MELNSLLKKFPHLFQFQMHDFDAVEQVSSPNEIKAEFKKFNSKRDASEPFSKPISKIIQIYFKNDAP